MESKIYFGFGVQSEALRFWNPKIIFKLEFKALALVFLVGVQSFSFGILRLINTIALHKNDGAMITFEAKIERVIFSILVVILSGRDTKKKPRSRNDSWAFFFITEITTRGAINLEFRISTWLHAI